MSFKHGKYDYKLHKNCFSSIITQLNLFPISLIYSSFDSLFKPIKKIKNTYYKKFLLTNDFDSIRTISEYDQYTLKFRTTGEKITLKNIYNFSKSLVHYSHRDKYIQFPNNWKSLSTNHRNEILRRLNNQYDDCTDWFNIAKHIRRFYHVYNTDRIKEINKNIFNLMRIIIIDCVFDNLIMKGILTEFIPNSSKFI
jgi:hypothetical protein